MRPVLLSLLFLCGFAGASAWAKPFEMDILETDDLLLLYFDPPQTYLSPHVARSFENSMAFQKEIFEWTPWDKTTVVLKDFGDYGNAAARSSPNNALMVDIAPLSRTFETFTASERVFALMNHELIHVATMDVWNASDDRWRKFFRGKPMPTEEHPETILYNYLTTPRVNVPRWYLEGSAVFMETWMGGGIGRAMGAYDEMVFRSMVRDDAHFYSALGLVSEGTHVDFQVGVNAYLYGTRFMSYLALEYSPQHVVDWLKRGEGSKRYYSSQFKMVFDKPLSAAWKDWIAWERQYQEENLAAIRAFLLTPARPLVDKALGSISRSFVNPQSDSLIGAFRYPGVLAHVGELSLEDGTVRRIRDIKGPMLYKVTSLAYDPESGTAWYTADNYKFRELMEVDIATGKTRMLLKDARIGEMVFNPKDRSLWGVRHLNGFATLVQMEAPYEKWNQIHTFPYGEILYDMDISPDGTLLSSSKGEVTGGQSLRIYRLADLLGGRIKHIARFEFGTAVPEGFVFSPDGKFLYGSSYYTGVSNIFRFEIATSEIEAVSNAESGFFRPIPREDGSLIVFEYTGQGFVPKVIDPVPLEDLSAVRFLGNEVVKKHPIVKTWGVGSPTKIDLESRIIHTGKYRPVRELKLGSAYPVVEGYKDTTSIGWHFDFDDPMQFNQLDLTLSYSVEGDVPDEERFHARLKYRAVKWSFEYWHNGADFYDLFGPTERARKGDAFLFEYNLPKVDANLSYYTGLDTLPNNQNVTLAASDIVTGSLTYEDERVRKSLGSVDHEQGVIWDLRGSTSVSDNKISAKAHGGVDFGVSLPWSHSSVWAYNSVGVSNGDRGDALSNFYFGAFGNNYVDDGEVKRYRSFDTLPGFGIGEIAAGSFAKSVVELNLPPLRFRKAGVPALYLGYVRPALFASAMVSDPGSIRERTFTNVGAQLDLQFTLAHRLPMTLSLGYAIGFEDGDKEGEEVMISLKIL